MPRRNRVPLAVTAAACILVPPLLLGAASNWVRVVVLPNGSWVVARTSVKVLSDGRRYRDYLSGDDWTVRQELDVDGDGVWALRGDDCQAAAPTACWERRSGSWSPVPPQRCADAWSLFLK